MDIDDIVKRLPNLHDLNGFIDIIKKKDKYAYVYVKMMKNINKLINYICKGSSIVDCLCYKFTKDNDTSQFEIPSLTEKYEIAKNIGGYLGFKYIYLRLNKKESSKTVNISEIQKDDIKNIILLFCNY